jgi:nucleotide-binding universal stress UspA family protein
MFKNILIPTDGSDLAQRAATQGVELAKALGAKVTAFYAAPPATPIIYRDHLPAGYATPAEHQEMIDELAAKHLAFVEQTAGKAGVPCETVRTVSDYPHEDILKVARDKSCDAIVMGSHGSGGLRGVFIGSVTQKVLNQTKIPVVVFH